jgi:hypothetical protein
MCVTNGGDTVGAAISDAVWDFSISYNQADKAWAEWISSKLEEASHRDLVQARDLVPETNWVFGVQEATIRMGRKLAVLTELRTTSAYGSTEWQTARRTDSTGASASRSSPGWSNATAPKYLGTRFCSTYLVTTQEKAQEELLRAVRLAAAGARAKLATEPEFLSTSPAAPTTPSLSVLNDSPVNFRQDSPASSSKIGIGIVSAPGGLSVRTNYGKIMPVRNGPHPELQNQGQPG